MFAYRFQGIVKLFTKIFLIEVALVNYSFFLKLAFFEVNSLISDYLPFLGRYFRLFEARFNWSDLLVRFSIHLDCLVFPSIGIAYLETIAIKCNPQTATFFPNFFPVQVQLMIKPLFRESFGTLSIFSSACTRRTTLVALKFINYFPLNFHDWK